MARMYTYYNPSTDIVGSYTTVSTLSTAHNLNAHSIRVAFSRAGKDVIHLRGGEIIIRTNPVKNSNLARKNGFG
jgi:hypothetical protein